VRTVGRTAVIAGTASAVGGRVQHRQQEKYAANEAPAPAPAPAPAAAPAGDDSVAQLEQLADLHSKGILTDEEFSAKKAQILGL
jgi:hypothetical protein